MSTPPQTSTPSAAGAPTPLHAWPIPAREYARHEERRGRRVAELHRTSGGSGPLAGRLWPQLIVDEGRDLIRAGR